VGIIDPLETINPAESSARIDRHSTFGIVLFELRFGHARAPLARKTGAFSNTLSSQIVPLTSAPVRER